MVDNKKLSEIFNLTEREVETLKDAALTYEVRENNPSYKDWCVMYDGIHRENSGETAIRNWLAFRRWQKSVAQPTTKELLNFANELSNTSTPEQFRMVLTTSQLLDLFEYARSGILPDYEKIEGEKISCKCKNQYRIYNAWKCHDCGKLHPIGLGNFG
jgi:hypothetical protein